ncbi:hypothetical protein [Sphingorhabdus sp.]|jgi:hypothetical protein|uniref:hypothetical protein n=1 Tax=Sphingorhabdus sp. TaxID=1902408 RepID=UPI003784CD3F
MNLEDPRIYMRMGDAKMKLRQALSIVSVGIGLFMLAAPSNAFAKTHCLQNEVNLYSGKMDTLTSEGTPTPNVTAKYVSLCADSLQKMTAVYYRFGPIGSVEMEIVAPNETLIFVEDFIMEPRMTWTAYSFFKGNYTYSLSMCVGGSCNGSMLAVHRESKLLGRRFSEYETNSGLLFEDSYDLPKFPSEIFLDQKTGFDLGDE